MEIRIIITDSKWIELDNHQNDPHQQQLTIKAFPIYSNEKFDTVRLIQTGLYTFPHGNYHLCINAIDIEIHTKIN